jgi:thiamine kinase-like enzyme
MNSDEVKRLARRVPRLAQARNLSAAFLSGGLTNKNYRVDADGESFVLRLPGENTGLLGIDRQHEAYNHRVAAAAGVAPGVVVWIEPEGCLVTRFIGGQRIPPERLRAPEMIRRVVKALCPVHTGPAFRGVFSPFRTFERYRAMALERKGPLPDNLSEIQKLTCEIERALYLQSPLAPCPIHADLLTDNFLADGDSVRILDWEYSGMGDMFFDLANFAAHHQFGDEEERCLLQASFGDCREHDRARLRLMRIMSDLREAMWGVVQVRISRLDFDFEGYARQFFERMGRQAADPQYPNWLKLAAGTGAKG